jgi:hypothetical protein
MAHPALNDFSRAQSFPFKQIHGEQVARLRQNRLAARFRARASRDCFADQRSAVGREEAGLLIPVAAAHGRQYGGGIKLQVADVAQPVEERRDDFLGLAG